MRDGTHILITGAGGFIGAYLTRWFAALGHRVTAAVRTRDKSGGLGSNIEVVAGDLAEPSHLPPRFDVLVHCAAEIPSRCPDARRLYDGNVQPARALFEQSPAAGASVIIYLSSMSVYGNISAELVTECLAPCAPDMYGLAKSAGERLLEGAVSDGLQSGLSIRLPGTVGRGSHDNFLSEAVARAERGETLRGRHPDALFNNIVFVGNLAAFIDTWIRHRRRGYFAVNLAAREPIPIRRVFSIMFAALGRGERITYEDGGKRPFLISIEKALRLGFGPMSVEESIVHFVKDWTTKEDDPATLSALRYAAGSRL